MKEHVATMGEKILPWLVIILIVWLAVWYIGKWFRRLCPQREPVPETQSVPVRVVAKRPDFNGTEMTYYVTFQMADGQRLELSVEGVQYGMLAERDVGILNYQEDQFLDFKRKVDIPHGATESTEKAEERPHGR